jgi:hypothetical protein
MLPPKKRLLDQVRDRLRLKNYAYRTEKSYLYWIKQYILFHNKRHPNEMGSSEIEQFLTQLAAKKKVAASTQNQALSALLFLYREVLDLPPDLTFQSLQARRPKHLPTVLSKTEVERVLRQMSGETLLMTQLWDARIPITSVGEPGWAKQNVLETPSSSFALPCNGFQFAVHLNFCLCKRWERLKSVWFTQNIIQIRAICKQAGRYTLS